ncbi:MAG: hypothetical protein PHW93_06585 [Candidatus Methanomethylophilaceae archaeon]|nr:hypothetical protein [Candidatus Methanomethylophilaceae archaeon]
MKGGLLLSVTNIFDLDMNQKPIDDYYAFLVNQTDYQSRTVQANLYITYTKGGSRTVYNLTSETVTISYAYTDENGDLIETYEFSCTKAISIGNNVITFVIPNVVVENFGSVKAQVKVYADVSTVLNSVLFSFYVNESLSVGLTPATELPLLYVSPIIGSVAPTTSTVGLLGQLYIDETSPTLYYCSDITGDVYIWTAVGLGGISSGGSIGQALVKASSSDYDTEWETVLKPSDVVNNLTTTDDDVPLSATQGKVLQDEIDSHLIERFLLNNIIVNTTENITYTNDDITQIVYLLGENIFRTDTFSYPDENTIIEVHELSTGESITITYNFSTNTVEVSSISTP